VKKSKESQEKKGRGNYDGNCGRGFGLGDHSGGSDGSSGGFNDAILSLFFFNDAGLLELCSDYF